MGKLVNCWMWFAGEGTNSTVTHMCLGEFQSLWGDLANYNASCLCAGRFAATWANAHTPQWATVSWAYSCSSHSPHAGRATFNLSKMKGSLKDNRKSPKCRSLFDVKCARGWWPVYGKTEEGKEKVTVSASFRVQGLSLLCLIHIHWNFILKVP